MIIKVSKRRKAIEISVKVKMGAQGGGGEERWEKIIAPPSSDLTWILF